LAVGEFAQRESDEVDAKRKQKSRHNTKYVSLRFNIGQFFNLFTVALLLANKAYQKVFD